MEPADRRDVLELVRAGAVGVTAAEVAAKTGLRPSTARDHLDGLVRSGLLVKARASAGVPYRPAWRYRASAADPVPPAYRILLAAVLGHLDTTGDPKGAAAVRVGQRWGRMLAAAHTGGRGSRDTLLAVLDALGFSPREIAPDDGGPAQVHLLACPYLTLVREHPDAMCRLHAGVVQGVLREGGEPDDAAVLEPFAAPAACVVRLRS